MPVIGCASGNTGKSGKREAENPCPHTNRAEKAQGGGKTPDTESESPSPTVTTGRR